MNDDCTNKKKALPLKIIAIVTILISSMIGVCLPLVTQSALALSPERSLFVIVKAFAAGIILATGFMHVLPDSFDMLSSACLKENPWHKFPFTGFVAMLSAIITFISDSMATIVYSKKHGKSGVVQPENCGEQPEELAVAEAGHSHFHGHHHGAKKNSPPKNDDPNADFSFSEEDLSADFDPEPTYYNPPSLASQVKESVDCLVISVAEIEKCVKDLQTSDAKILSNQEFLQTNQEHLHSDVKKLRDDMTILKDKLDTILKFSAKSS